MRDCWWTSLIQPYDMRRRRLKNEAGRASSIMSASSVPPETSLITSAPEATASLATDA